MKNLLTRRLSPTLGILLACVLALTGLLALQSTPARAADTITLTLVGSSIDGGNTVEPYVVEVERGSTWSEFDFDEKDTTIPAYFTEENYALHEDYPRVMKQPLTSYDSWEAVGEESISNLDTPLNEDTTFYVALAKYVDTVDLTVTAPVCGEVSEVSERDEETGVKVTGSYPVVTSNNDQVEPYGPERDLYGELTLAGSVWLENETTPLNGTLEGGKSYLAQVGVAPTFGYGFTDGTEKNPSTLIVNNANGDEAFVFKTYEGYVGYGYGERLVSFTIDAEHDWEDEGEVTVEPTATTEGEVTYKCKHFDSCGGTKTEPIPPIDPDAPITLTLKGSSALDDYTAPEDYTLTLKPGDTWDDVASAELEQAVGERFTGDGYALFGGRPYITTKPLSEYGSWDEVVAEDAANAGVKLSKNTTYYVAVAKYVDAVDLTAVAPVCGEVSEVVEDEAGVRVAGSYPVVTSNNKQVEPAGAQYKRADGPTMAGALWLENDTTPLNGTLVGGKTYLAEACVEPAFGYQFDDADDPATLAVAGANNGSAEFCEKNYAGEQLGSYDARLVRFSIGAEHDWEDEGEVTVEPTATTEGEMTYKCRHYDICGATRTEPIPMLTTVKLTLVGSSIDDGHSAPELVLEVERGSTWGDIDLDTKEGIILEHFTEEGYTLYGYYPRVMTKPLTEFDSWAEVTAESVLNLTTEFNEDTTFYVALAKFIDAVELTIEPPRCGEVSEVVRSGLITTEVLGSYPVVAEHNDQVVPFGPQRELIFGIKIAGALWLEDGETPLNGTLMGGQTYLAELGVEPAIGYQFDEDQHTGRSDIPAPSLTVINANGDEEFRWESYSYGYWIGYDERLIRFTIDAEHDWSEWAETTAATCTEAGEEMRECKSCGEKETREIEALGHDWGEWTVTKEPTVDAEGEEMRSCVRCGEVETRPIPKLDPEPKPEPTPEPEPEPTPTPKPDPGPTPAPDTKPDSKTDSWTQPKPDTPNTGKKSAAIPRTGDPIVSLWMPFAAAGAASIALSRRRREG